MALDQNQRNGVVYIGGTTADIETARLASTIIVGRLYHDITLKKWGRGELNDNTTDITKTNVINWEIVQSDIDAAVLVETNRALAAEQVIASGLADEIARATLEEGVLRTAVATEATRAQAAEQVLTSGLASEASTRQTADATEQAARIAGDATLDTQIQNEAVRAIAQEGILTTNLGNEVLDRTLGDAQIQAALDAEILRAITREDAIEQGYQTADAALETSVLAAVQASLDAYADKDVRSVIKAAYTDGGTLSIATLLGASPVDGVHAIFCTSTSLANAATMTSPVALATGEEVVDFGDQYHVTVNGGVVTAVVKVDSIFKAKFDALDSSISTLNAATAQSALRSHFSATGWATYNPATGETNVSKSEQSGNNIIDGTDGKAYLSVQGTSIRYTVDGNLVDETVSNTITDIYAQLADVSANLVQAENGLSIVAGNVELGGALTKITTITGAFPVDFQNTSIGGKIYVGQCYQSVRNAQGIVIGKGAEIAGQKAEMWFDQDGDPKFTIVTSPN